MDAVYAHQTGLPARTGVMTETVLVNKGLTRRTVMEGVLLQHSRDHELLRSVFYLSRYARSRRP